MALVVVGVYKDNAPLWEKTFTLMKIFAIHWAISILYILQICCKLVAILIQGPIFLSNMFIHVNLWHTIQTLF